MKIFASLLIFLSVAFSGCLIFTQRTSLPPAPYEANTPLTGQIIHSPSGDMIAAIPQGWILLDPEDKAGQNTILILTDTAYSGVIFFQSMPATQQLMADVNQNGLGTAARKSFQRVKEKTRDAAALVSEYQTFGVEDREFCSYEYTADRRRSLNRVVLFDTGTHIYECVAAQLSTDGKPVMGFHALCAAQQSVVNSIRW